MCSKFYDLQIFTDVMKCGRRSYIPSNKYVILLQEYVSVGVEKKLNSLFNYPCISIQNRLSRAINQQLQQLTKELVSKGLTNSVLLC